MTDAPRPTRVRFIVVFFLGSLAFLTYFDRVCISRAADDIKQSLEISKEQMGLIMGAFWLAYALFEIPAGWMGDRFGTRVTIARIVLAWSVFTALSGVATGFWSLLLWRFLFGVGEAGAFPNIARIHSQWLPVSSRASAGGLLWLLARWGGAASPVIFGAMMAFFNAPHFRNWVAGIPGLSGVATAESWRWAFWACGFIGLIWVAAFYWWFRDHPSQMPSVNEAELKLITAGAPKDTRGHSMPRKQWGQLFSSGSLWAMGIYYLCGSFGWSFFVSWMPDFYKERLNVPYERSEWLTAAPLFFGGIACILGGTISHYLVRRTGSRWIGRAVLPMIGCATAGLCMVLIPFAKTPAQIAVLLTLTAFAYDLGQAANWATIVDIGGRYAGVTAGLINLIGNMGNAFQPYMGPVIIKHFGWNTLFGVFAVAYLISCSMWLFINPNWTFYGDKLTSDSSEPH